MKNSHTVVRSNILFYIRFVSKCERFPPSIVQLAFIPHFSQPWEWFEWFFVLASYRMARVTVTLPSLQLAENVTPTPLDLHRLRVQVLYRLARWTTLFTPSTQREIAALFQSASIIIQRAEIETICKSKHLRSGKADRRGNTFSSSFSFASLRKWTEWDEENISTKSSLEDKSLKWNLMPGKGKSWWKVGVRCARRKWLLRCNFITSDDAAKSFSFLSANEAADDF